ncbi:MAG: nucleoside-diphosphate kinase [Acidobacteria bacterium RIFCSPLOWO2_12_FULL_60_22]|nr:MAG: nucleoside-diphosphate kinase [Acidobacteria bacterium RIFCSPLOWO2_12_FULL_60_22]
MALQRTLTIIKPDGVAQNNIGDVIRVFEENRFQIVAMRMLRLTKQQAEGFYAVHRGRPFFDSLTTFMSSGRVVVMVLEAEDVIARLRAVMGATNPAQAADGTLRKRFATSLERNVIHGSDAPETAAFEIRYFFSEMEILS